MALPNALLGNLPDAATLEATIIGPELRFERDATIAITGADLQPTLEGTPLAMGSVVECASGSVLRFGNRRAGARAYIAVDGGIGVSPVLGSRATHVASGLGGVAGRALRAGATAFRFGIVNAPRGGRHGIVESAGAAACGCASWPVRRASMRIRRRSKCFNRRDSPCRPNRTAWVID